MFQDFQLSVTPLDRDRYLLRTEKVFPGVPLAEAQVEWPVMDWLAEARQLMDDPLLRLLQGDSASPDSPLLFKGNPPDIDLPSSHPLMLLGQKLYNALFQGPLRDSWVAAQSVAHSQRSVLRLRLGLKGSLLPRIPWEILHAAGIGPCYRFLTTGTEITFSRYQVNTPLGSPTLPFKRSHREPLRILMAIAGPNDQETIDLEQEAKELKAELNRETQAGQPAIELHILAQPGRDEITQALERGHYDVFHYAGHSNLGDSGGNIYLVSRLTTLTETLSGEDLAGLLVNNGVKLAVFNSCRSADTAFGDNEEGNLAQALVKCGIPAVLAMAERIPDEAALTLTRLFYRNLDCGYPLDLSLNRARQGLISTYGSRQLYWALPVLYLHPLFDGWLTKPENLPDVSEDLFETLDEDIPLSVLARDRYLDELDDIDGEDEAFLNGTSLNGYSSDSDFGGNDDDDAADFIKSMFNDLADAQTEEAESPEESTPPPDSPPPTVAVTVPKTPPKRKSHRKFRPWLLGGIGAIAIAGVGLGIFLNRPSELATPSNAPSTASSVAPNGENLDKVYTENLTSIAIEQLSRGNLEKGDLAVTELLNRNALPFAQAALNSVPVEQQDRPSILFLKGRLAWQSVLNGNTDFSIDDARRFWEQAVARAPESILYHNALGFAYYEEGDYNRANQAWSDALELGQQELVSAETEEDDPLLTTYAGLAIALRQMAEDDSQTTTTQKTLLNKALKLRQMVLSEAPIQFQPDTLSQNWLWSEKAIQDWQDAIDLTE
jgi:hypothetical protein